MTQIPYVEGTGKLTTLYVDGKPFFARAGEIHNSSSSDPAYMDERVWPALRDMHLNCVVAPIYWECVEPEEGTFDFSLIDSLLSQARREQVRLVLLWFGLWKNSASSYIPSWAKLDPTRFPVVQAPGGVLPRFINGLPHRIVTPLSAAAVAADAKAFSAVMAHLKETDPEHTVIAVQVENEIGIVGCARDYSAEEAFAQAVPQALQDALGVSGTWSEAFGPDAEETFMAWHYGRAVEQIAAAGKAQLGLPMYVNAWLEQAPWTPGTYPSGGPQFKMHKIWRAAAPSIDWFAPDIYVDHYRQVCDEYASDGNPLFIPEVRNSADAVAFYLYAVGAHNALCFAPFGVEDMTGRNQGLDEETLAVLNISSEAMRTGGSAGALLGDVYQKVAGMEELIYTAHREGRIHGFLDGGERTQTVHLDGLGLTFSFGGANPFAPRPKGQTAAGGLVIQLAPYQVLILATGCTVSFSLPEGEAGGLEILRKEEGTFQNSRWVRGRILNGDEQYMNTFGQPAEMQLFTFYRYE